ncbi:MAG: hypothetical protein WDO16_12020 [Bacteroidota bacterium]
MVKSPFLRVKDVSATGVESPTLADRDTFNITNPLVITDNATGFGRSYRFLGSVGFNYQLAGSLSLATTIGIVYDKTRESFFIPGKGVTMDTVNSAIVTSRSGSMVKSFFFIV